MKIKNILLGLAVAAAVALPAAATHAADMPPPIEDLRSTYDWSGAYVGVFGAATALDGDWSGSDGCGCVYSKIESSGIGYSAGVLGGWNYQFDSTLVGIEGDWAFGGKLATNDEPAIDTFMRLNNLATLRGRAGLVDGNTLFYLTGGLAAADSEFGGPMGPAQENVSDSKWLYGWTAGAGIEHAFSNNLRARLEYLYVSLPNGKYHLAASTGETLDATHRFKNMNIVRAGITYNFTW
ncbi:MAG: porin family protein [Rhizobiales bacterium]|nr:porin family protein [Hyphomicrobiales bacterium]MBI3672978.1 porin family protein [Hyphomicrobiales bacterium]